MLLFVQRLINNNRNRNQSNNRKTPLLLMLELTPLMLMLELTPLLLYKYHKFLAEQRPRGLILPLANFQLVAIGSLRSGLLGNQIGGLHFCD